jgi:hypothetical protein
VDIIKVNMREYVRKVFIFAPAGEMAMWNSTRDAVFRDERLLNFNDYYIRSYLTDPRIFRKRIGIT